MSVEIGISDKILNAQARTILRYYSQCLQNIGVPRGNQEQRAAFSRRLQEGCFDNKGLRLSPIFAETKGGSVCGTDASKRN